MSTKISPADFTRIVSLAQADILSIFADGDGKVTMVVAVHTPATAKRVFEKAELYNLNAVAREDRLGDRIIIIIEFF